MENQDLKIYIKGFEHGYWLEKGNSKDLPELIERSKNHARYSAGLRAGSKEAKREVIRDRMQNNSEQSNDVQKDIDID